ncbi:MAG: winged-helix domain-containing protein [Clostridia bacterium]|nr:winged-helix domain-containing protein [Clostridia bacterium]
MNILIASKDAVFSRMLMLEFSEKGFPVFCAQTLEETKTLLSRAHLALIEASFLSQGKLPEFPYDIILFGYPEDFKGIARQELTKYYTLTRPFVMEDFWASLFDEEKETVPFRLRVQKRKNPSESLALDTASQSAYYKGEKIILTNKEFALLALLYENKGTAVSRETALREVFADAGEKTNVVDVYINYLRVKIDHKFGIRMIGTVRGFGYIIQ